MNQKDPKDPSELRYTSTKQAIWAAYKDLKKRRGDTAKTGKSVGNDADVDWRQLLMRQANQLDSQLREKHEEHDTLSKQISQARLELEELFQIKAKAQKLSDLEEKVCVAEEQWTRRQAQLEEEFEQDKAWREQRIEKEEEEKRYGLEIKRRKLEHEIGQMQKQWQEKEKDYERLIKEEEKRPETLEKIQEEVRTQTTERMQASFEQEKKLTNQKHESEVQLLNQQVQSLQEKTKVCEDQTRSLSKQLGEAHFKIKELAVVALKSRDDRVEKPASEGDAEG